MVDKTLILRKFVSFDEYFKQIEEYSNISINDYANNWKTQRIIDRTLQMMIETCLDVAGHIISDERLRAPESYVDMFNILVENVILNQELLPSLEKMAKFRNIIVHQYEKIDQEIVIGILKMNLQDFKKYRDSIIKYLKKSQL